MQCAHKKRWLNPAEFEEEFQIKINTQVKMRKERRIPFSKVGGFVKYDRLKIDKWLEKHSIVE